MDTIGDALHDVIDLILGTVFDAVLGAVTLK